MKIGVSGASGHLGKATIAELVRLGDHYVVGISRTPETIAAPAQGRFGDYDRPESLMNAYAGLDRLLIITTVAPEPGKRGVQNVAAIDAAVKAGVKHIVFMSAVNTRQEEEPARGASYWRGKETLIPPPPSGALPRVKFLSQAFWANAQACPPHWVLSRLARERG